MVKGKIMSLTLIIIGLMVFSYPRASELYIDYQQEKLMQEWRESLADIEDNEVSEGDNECDSNVVLAENIEGMLIIDKIDLNLPILIGSTKDNMRKSATSIENTGKLGQMGNYGIAGHRNRTYGSIFNRLDEVYVGDNLKLDDGKTQYNYEVVEKLYVKPEETWVLSSSMPSKEVTLITCHPQGNSTHRLVIKGRILE